METERARKRRTQETKIEQQTDTHREKQRQRLIEKEREKKKGIEKKREKQKATYIKENPYLSKSTICS